VVTAAIAVTNRMEDFVKLTDTQLVLLGGNPRDEISPIKAEISFVTLAMSSTILGCCWGQCIVGGLRGGELIGRDGAGTERQGHIQRGPLAAVRGPGLVGRLGPQITQPQSSVV
jgi:hypothetical protein